MLKRDCDIMDFAHLEIFTGKKLSPVAETESQF
jgi:hypothetical protein